MDGGALASARPPAAIASATVAPVSWKGRDGGTGFVVCGSNESWVRPTIDEENAHLAADPRYAGVRADDSYSRAWLPFRAGASLFDGSSSDERDDLVALTGLWNDPHFAANASACASIEPQIWLFGYAPTKYTAEDQFIATLQVTPAPGYRLVVLTGVIRPQLVVAGSMKVAFFAMPTSAVTPTFSARSSTHGLIRREVPRPRVRSRTCVSPPSSIFPRAAAGGKARLDSRATARTSWRSRVQICVPRKSSPHSIARCRHRDGMWTTADSVSSPTQRTTFVLRRPSRTRRRNRVQRRGSSRLSVVSEPNALRARAALALPSQASRPKNRVRTRPRRAIRRSRASR